MRRSLGVLATLSLLLVLGTVAGARAANAGRIYRLGERSTFQRGCFPPCMCPILDAASLRGTFRLVPDGSDGPFRTFSVTDVSWTASVGGSEVRITGGGRYRVGGEVALEQQLELDLAVGDDPVQHFDSGLVPGEGEPFPAIRVTVSINGMFCYDTALTIDAAPVRRSEIRRYTLVEPSTFQQSCDPPCDCPSGPELPIRGRFRLVPLSPGLLFAEFAVTDVRWRVRRTTPADARRVLRIRGSGDYMVGGEFAVEQRLALDLVLDGESEAHLDSGLVLGGGGFPARIDVPTSSTDVCAATKIDVHAVQSPRRP